MSLTKDEVRHVASLARLELTDDEVAQMATDLGKILEHVEQLRAVDTRDVTPTEHLAVDRLPLRADQPRPGLTPEQALSPAPRTLSDGFAVPAFVDEE